MKQLTLDENLFKEINYWKNKNDIPNEIIEYIINKSNFKPIYEKNTGKFYCSKCLKELNINFCCHKCQKKYDKTETYTIEDIKEIKNFKETYRYFVFDIVDEDVLLYSINENISYYNPLAYGPYKTIYIEIENVYHIEHNCFTNLENNKKIFYDEIDNFDYDVMDLTYDKGYLYPNNLEKLKNTLYRYTLSWKIKDNINDLKFNILSLTYGPLHFKQFEYLMKFNLYTLAFDNFYNIKYDKNFLNKENISFMIKNNFNCNNYKAFELCKEKDMNLITFITNHLEIIEDITSLVSINLTKLKKYYEKNKIDLYVYYDYLRMAKELQMNLKSILYPKNLLFQHDKLSLEITIKNDPKINDKIKEFSKILEINNYEDEKYIITPAHSIDDLINESSMQNNCVRSYCKDYSNRQTQIYFMRRKSDINKSFVTIEVVNKKIRQARIKNNKLPNKEIVKILEKWEKNLKYEEEV